MCPPRSTLNAQRSTLNAQPLQTLNLPIMAAQPQSLPPRSGAIIVMRLGVAGPRRRSENSRRTGLMQGVEKPVHCVF
ncbi:MAG: hypothetical protein M0Q87_11835 [Ottowia sp.]|nr:hypothetical protein [Ottowia sp.]